MCNARRHSRQSPTTPTAALTWVTRPPIRPPCPTVTQCDSPIANRSVPSVSQSPTAKHPVEQRSCQPPPPSGRPSSAHSPPRCPAPSSRPQPPETWAKQCSRQTPGLMVPCVVIVPTNQPITKSATSSSSSSSSHTDTAAQIKNQISRPNTREWGVTAPRPQLDGVLQPRSAWPRLKA